MPSALVTGASGFIGPHLVANLQRAGYDVTCLVRATSNRERLEPLAPAWAEGDLRDAEKLKQAVVGHDYVFHLGGLVKAFSAQELLEVNEAGTGNLLEACAARETPPQVLIVSSLAAAGPSPNQHLRSETELAKPVSNYGRSKQAQEAKAAMFADRVPISVIRPPIVFGEGDDAMLAMFRPIRRTRIHFVPGLFPRQFSLVHAADLAEAMRLVAERGERISATGKPGQGVYFPASDEHPTYAELGQRIGRSLGHRRTFVLYSPLLFTWIAASGAELVSRVRGKQQIFNLDKAREAAAGNWTCDPSKLRQELGWQNAATLDERLRQTAEWYREKRWL